ncbi:MAG: hypothetical protein K2N41_06215 [Lachnospiraceae bacterium]|nr:hypothetical protein [Lachnospiraceae bacterium]
MLYSLFAPMWRTNDVLRKLLREVLGYNDDEIKILESERFGRNIVNNLTIEQAKDITKIFNDNDFQMYLNDGRGSDGIIFWNQLGIDWVDEPPKGHYCDKPLVSREHLADLSIPKKVDPPIKESLFNAKPIVKCPYCHSEDTKKISATAKVVNTAIFGIFGSKRHKQWHCNSCNSDF